MSLGPFAESSYSERDHSADLLAVCEMLCLFLMLRSMVLPKLIVFFFDFAKEIRRLLHTDRLLPHPRIHQYSCPIHLNRNNLQQHIELNCELLQHCGRAVHVRTRTTAAIIDCILQIAGKSQQIIVVKLPSVHMCEFASP